MADEEPKDSNNMEKDEEATEQTAAEEGSANEVAPPLVEEAQATEPQQQSEQQPADEEQKPPEEEKKAPDDEQKPSNSSENATEADQKPSEEQKSLEEEQKATDAEQKPSDSSENTADADQKPSDDTPADNVEKPETEPKSDGSEEKVDGEKPAGSQEKVEEQSGSSPEVAKGDETAGSQEKVDEVKPQEKVADGEEAAGSQEKVAEEGAVGTTEKVAEGEQAAGSQEKLAEGEQTEDKPKVADGMDPNTRGDEDEIASEVSKNVDDEEERIPDDFYYEYADHVSTAVISEDSGLPPDLLTMHHSFGYDCTKRTNLHILDTEHVLFCAGNFVQLLNIKTKEQKYVRSTSGGGIGAVCVHPSRNYFAVAEKGSAPNINVYEYPSMKLYRILRGGTEKAYAYVDFSPDGKLLASVGGDPDYMLTLWDWKNEKTVLRSKAFSQEVYRVTFSTELEGQLTSSGMGHIRFWKMAKTFTGLKLQGQLGKFGKTEISDIEGYVELPDGKVLSGSEWGNLLLWDGGLIKVEIGKKGGKNCHNGVISQIIMDEGELMTVGIDGYIRVWDFETIDTADATDESGIFEMEPMNELKVGNDVALKSIVKSPDEEEPTMWFAQDANGGIWKLDLSFSFTSEAPNKLAGFHSGSITGCDSSPVSSLVATCGVDRKVVVYDFMTKEPLCRSKFNSPATNMLWMPKIVDPKGSTLVVGFRDGVIRILNFMEKDDVDIHGRKVKDQSELFLRQALKPHNETITSIGVDSKGEILATGSSDSTVFFFHIGDNYEPIGFVKTPSAVTHLSWSPGKFKRNTLLVSCAAGEVMEVESPEEGKFDTSKSYEITGLNIRTHIFKSIKSRLRHEEEMAIKAKEEEERKKKEEEERRIRIERGEQTEEDLAEKEEEEEPEEEVWEPYIPEEPSPILYGFHAKEEGKFWLSMGGFDAGYIYECEFLNEQEKQRVPPEQLYEPCRTIPIHNSDDTPIKTIRFSGNGTYMVMGLENGSVRIQPIHSEDVGLMGPYWSLPIHDNHYGEISHIAGSHDDKFLFTVGDDGNFFAFEFMDQEKVDQKVAEAKAKIPSAKKELKDKRVDDIEDPKAYSIEDAKQKSEYDKMMRLAEEKKVSVRETIEDLRAQFKVLLGRNYDLPEQLQLNKKEFEMDPEIKNELQKHKEEKIAMVKKEMAWEEEKHRIALDKLKSRFKDVVECERIVVKAFRTEHEVSSFRAHKLSDDFYNMKAEMDRRRTTWMSREEASRKTTEAQLTSHTSGLEKDSAETADRENTEFKVVTTLKGAMGERITKQLHKVEEKKKKRAARRAQWAQLEASKPSDDYEDPEDVAAIKWAENNMGDYKLKSADDYVVPDHLRMNADKAKTRLLHIKDLMHKHKYDFNQRLLELRDKKLRVIEDIKKLVRQLAVAQRKLNLPQAIKPLPPIPKMHPEELPEKKYEYTRETLLKFKEKLKIKEEMIAKGLDPDAVVEESGFGGGGFGGAGPTKPDNDAVSVKSSVESHKKEDFTTDQIDMDSMSPLELQIRHAEEIRLHYECDQLRKQVDQLIENFDAELKMLRHHKFKMDITLKNADLRHVTLFEELLLLKDFEKQENFLADKVDAKHNEKLEMQNKVLEVNSKLELKKKEIEKLQEKEKALHATFVASLGENKFSDYLTKVFKKRIKRSKKKQNEGEGSDEDSEEDSDDDSDWSESEDESDSEGGGGGGYDLDVCPPGCDQNLYDNTCALREKRLDIEEALTEEKKAKEAMNKDLEGLNKKVKVIQVAFNQAEQELEAFQLEKQRKINELDVVVTLKLNQIQYVQNGQLPQDLSPTLVFEAAGVIKLTQRIKELEHEKTNQKRGMRESKKKHVQLIKDRRLFEQKISEMDEQCNKMMIDKFGQIVDLEVVETVTVNRQTEELKEKLRINEIQCATELAQWEETIQDHKDHITDLIRENTAKLDQLNMLLSERKSYEKDLDSRQKNLGDEYGGARKAEIHERQRLIQLVHLQAQEVEALKEEITLLSRKGGHILPPAQPPMPPSAQARAPMPPPNQ